MHREMIIYNILCNFKVILLLLTDARAFPISSPELPGTAPRLAFGEEKKTFQLDPIPNKNSAT